MRPLRHSFSSTLFRLCLVTTLSILSLTGFAQLAGTYYIGPADSARADFNSFAAVADSLNTSGISDSVIFNILPGRYQVHIQLNDIVGADGNNQIVFQSSTGDSTDVIIDYNYTSSDVNWMIILNGTDFITFRNLSFNATSGSSGLGRVFIMQGWVSGVKFLNNVFYGKAAANGGRMDLIQSTSNYNHRQHILIEHNTFYNGENAVKIVADQSSQSPGNIIRYNNFFNPQSRGINLVGNDAPIISDNYFDVDLHDRGAIELRACDNAFRVINNIIEIENPRYAISLTDCDGKASLEGRIANNFIDMWKTGYINEGIRLDNTHHTQIYHNSVRIYSGWKTTSKCYHQLGSSSNIDARNNIFANHSGGYALSNASGSFSNTNNNDYYTNGNYLAIWGSSNIKDLADFKAMRTPYDDASLSVHPVFVSTTPSNLHTSTFHLKNAGADLSSVVPEDIDGQGRSATPCIGADEFINPTGAALSGTISIGSGQTYTSISQAVDSLNKYGISGGPVTFNIMDNGGAAYEESVFINYIAGADDANRVTFQPHPANTKDVIIQYGGQTDLQPWVVSLQRASYITLRDLTFTTTNSTYTGVMYFQGYCTGDSILNCNINSQGRVTGHYAVWAYQDEVHNLSLIGNTITDCGGGIGIWGISSSNRSTDIQIRDNILESQYAAAIYLEYPYKPIVSGNYMNSDNTTYDYYGIYVNSSGNGFEITGNKVICNTANHSIRVHNSKSSTGNEGLVANNIVDFRAGGSVAYGIEITNSEWVNVYFNTVKIGAVNLDAGSNAFSNTNGANICVQNNIFCNFGYGRAYYNEQTNAITASDNNVFFTGGNFIAKWGTADKATLADWQTASDMDNNSLVANPAFTDTDNLKSQSSFLDGAGIKIEELDADFDNIVRNDPPDIGALEFTSPFTPMSGVYTVYGTNPDFTSIRQAVDSLNFKGVSGPVDLAIRDGNHQEYVGSLYKITGASPDNTITIRSESGDNELVKIYSTEPQNLFWCRSVEYLTIKDLTISCTSPTTGRPLAFTGTSTNINILNNRLASSGNQESVLYLGNCVTDSVVIRDNIFSKGKKAIEFFGDSQQPSTKTYIIGNTANLAPITGMEFRYHTAPVILNNTISNLNNANFTGMGLYFCHEDFLVSGNKIDNANSGWGIYMSDCHGLEFFNGIVSNNVVSVGGTYTAQGISLASSEYTNIYHNSINITGTNKDNGFGLYTSSNNVGIKFINNNIANNGTGRAVRVDDASDIIASDFNNIYTVAEDRFVRWGGQYPLTLTELQGISSMDLNSRSFDSDFYSRSDLRSKQGELFKAGTDLIAEVPVDIDSVPRHATTPDLGAYQFTCDRLNLMYMF